MSEDSVTLGRREPVSIEALSALAEDLGLTVRGAFHPCLDDAVPALADGRVPRTLVVLGWVGGAHWPAFAASPERHDGTPHSLDRWSTRIIGELAATVDASPLYPFGGPPWHPFQRWGRRCEPVSASPLGLLIHPDFGLWHSYRGALAFADPLVVRPPQPRPAPCLSCAGRPCLSACPVDAFSPEGYDVARCASHVKSPAGTPCRQGGCLARRGCPVARDLVHGPEQARFYMDAFVADR